MHIITTSFNTTMGQNDKNVSVKMTEMSQQKKTGGNKNK